MLDIFLIDDATRTFFKSLDLYFWLSYLATTSNSVAYSHLMNTYFIIIKLTGVLICVR